MIVFKHNEIQFMEKLFKLYLNALSQDLNDDNKYLLELANESENIDLIEYVIKKTTSISVQDYAMVKIQFLKSRGLKWNFINVK